MPRHGVWGDSVQFTFDGGILDPVPSMTLQAAEIRSARWVAPGDWDDLLAPSQIRRYSEALEATRTGVPVYLRFGRHP